MIERAGAVPVVLLMYRRPAATAAVLAAVRAYRPAQLVVIADGPHPERPDDAVAVAAARHAVEAIDWPCVVTRHYAERNMGLRARVESGLHAVFAAHEAAIILEDDCIPDPSFFAYCSELLARYAAERQVMAISGDHFQPRPYPAASYYFSRYPHCWGWATWRRAWQHYDGAMAEWPQVRATSWLAEVLGDRRAASVWTTIFDQVAAGDIDSWAYRWTYSCWRAGGLTALPARNLVRNIGADAAATHTARSPFVQRPAQALAFPLRHPPRVVRNLRADAYTQRAMYDPPLWRRAAWRLRRMLG